MNFPWKDEWLAEDKIFHATGSFTAAAVLIWAVRYLIYQMQCHSGVDLFNELDPWWWRSPKVVCALVFLAGVGLEWYQYSHGIDYFSWKDIVWNTAGILAAWGVMR